MTSSEVKSWMLVPNQTQSSQEITNIVVDRGPESQFPSLLPSTPEKPAGRLRSSKESIQTSAPAMHLFGSSALIGQTSDWMSNMGNHTFASTDQFHANTPNHPPQKLFSGNSRDKIIVDVGGMTYKTTRSTLCQDQQSMLAALVRNQPENSDGALFIDRDGHRFRDVLYYLRVGTVHLENVVSLRELLSEAEFFGIQSLQTLCAEKIQETETKLLLEKEEKARLLKDGVTQLGTNLQLHLEYLLDGAYERPGKSRRVHSTSREHIFTMDDDF